MTLITEWSEPGHDRLRGQKPCVRGVIAEDICCKLTSIRRFLHLRAEKDQQGESGNIPTPARSPGSVLWFMTAAG